MDRICRAVRRSAARSSGWEEVRELAAGLPELDRIPPGKAASLARFASVAKAQAVARLPDDRRAATLVAFIRTLEASAGDDVIDLFRRGVDHHVLPRARDRQGSADTHTARSRRGRSAAARCPVPCYSTDDTADDAVRAAVFAGIERNALAEAVAQITLLAVPGDATYFAELRRHPGKLRYLPALLSGIELEAAPAGKPLLGRGWSSSLAPSAGARKPGPAPTAVRARGLGRSAQDERWGVRPRRLSASDGRSAASRHPSPGIGIAPLSWTPKMLSSEVSCHAQDPSSVCP